MDARLATALSHVAHDILSSNSTIKSLAAQLKGIEASDVILDASSKIHRLAGRLQRLATAHKLLEPPSSVSITDLAAIASHRFGITCHFDRRCAPVDCAVIHPLKLQQVLELLRELLESARMRVKKLELRGNGGGAKEENDAGGGARGFILVLEFESGDMLEDSLSLLLCEALMTSMRCELLLGTGQIELFMPGNAR